ncbi:MAG: hypothetical protein WC451_05775 [Patescibacteria group bacterium]|jgi:hypothetical protein
MGGEAGVVVPRIKSSNDVGDVRDNIVAIENVIKNFPDAMIGDCFPLRHTFVPGMYIREITMPKGSLLTSKIHKIEHPYFILRGDVSVMTEEGSVRIKAPFSGITPAGTKRLIYCHEETVWITVHKTDKTDLGEIEEEIIAKSFDELDNIIEINFKEQFILEEDSQ